MRKETSLPVRIEVQQKEDLDRICTELGLNTSEIIRMLVKSFQELYDCNNGQVEFPLKLKQ